MADIPLYFWFSDTHGDGNSGVTAPHGYHPYNVIATWYTALSSVSETDAVGVPKGCTIIGRLSGAQATVTDVTAGREMILDCGSASAVAGVPIDLPTAPSLQVGATGRTATWTATTRTLDVISAWTYQPQRGDMILVTGFAGDPYAAKNNGSFLVESSTSTTCVIAEEGIVTNETAGASAVSVYVYPRMKFVETEQLYYKLVENDAVDVTATDTITYRGAGSWPFEPIVGTKLTMSNFGTGANNGTFTVAKVTRNTIEFSETTLSVEAGQTDIDIVSETVARFGHYASRKIADFWSAYTHSDYTGSALSSLAYTNLRGEAVGTGGGLPNFDYSQMLYEHGQADWFRIILQGTDGVVWWDPTLDETDAEIAFEVAVSITAGSNTFTLDSGTWGFDACNTDSVNILANNQFTYVGSLGEWDQRPSPGDSITVTGFTDGGNNSTFTVASASATVITIEETTLTNESGQTDITIAVDGTPTIGDKIVCTDFATAGTNDTYYVKSATTTTIEVYDRGSAIAAASGDVATITRRKYGRWVVYHPHVNLTYDSVWPVGTPNDPNTLDQVTAGDNLSDRSRSSFGPTVGLMRWIADYHLKKNDTSFAFFKYAGDQDSVNGSTFAPAGANYPRPGAWRRAVGASEDGWSIMYAYAQWQRAWRRAREQAAEFILGERETPETNSWDVRGFFCWWGDADVAAMDSRLSTGTITDLGISSHGAVVDDLRTTFAGSWHNGTQTDAGSTDNFVSLVNPSKHSYEDNNLSDTDTFDSTWSLVPGMYESLLTVPVRTWLMSQLRVSVAAAADAKENVYVADLDTLHDSTPRDIFDREEFGSSSTSDSSRDWYTPELYVEMLPPLMTKHVELFDGKIFGVLTAPRVLPTVLLFGQSQIGTFLNNNAAWNTRDPDYVISDFFNDAVDDRQYSTDPNLLIWNGSSRLIEPYDIARNPNTGGSASVSNGRSVYARAKTVVKAASSLTTNASARTITAGTAWTVTPSPDDRITMTGFIHPTNQAVLTVVSATSTVITVREELVTETATASVDLGGRFELVTGTWESDPAFSAPNYGDFLATYDFVNDDNNGTFTVARIVDGGEFYVEETTLAAETGTPNMLHAATVPLTNFGGGQIGCEVSLLKNIQETLGQPVALLKSAWASSSLYVDQRGAAGTGSWDPAHSNLYSYMKQHFDWMRESAMADGKQLDVIAACFFQGFNDANLGVSTADYQAALTRLIDAVREDFATRAIGNPMPFLCMRSPTYYYDFIPQAQVDAIRAAQTAAIAAAQNPSALIDGDALEAQLVPIVGTDVHLDWESVVLTGQLFANGFKTAVGIS